MRATLSCINCNSKRSFDISDFADKKKIQKFINRRLLLEADDSEFFVGYEQAMIEISSTFCRMRKKEGTMKKQLRPIAKRMRKEELSAREQRIKELGK